MNSTSVPDKGRSFGQLTRFYNDEYRKLYSHFMSQGAVAQEIHAEAAAALDHLIGGKRNPSEITPEDYRAASAHLKRAVFDGFKLVFEKIRRTYERLMDEKYSDVHDGAFHPAIAEKFKQARDISNAARALEVSSRNPDYGKWEDAFEKWKGVLEIENYFDALLVDKSVVRMTGKTRRRRMAHILLKSVAWFATMILSVAYGENIKAVWQAFMKFVF